MNKKYKGLNVVCIICARQGSKGMPGKNIRKIAGKPLLAWTIETAKKCDFIKKTVVSTDGKEIAKVALRYGAMVPVMRPKRLATDMMPKMPALKHMVRYLEKKGEKIDIVIDSDPTNPLCEPKDIEKALKELVDKPDTDTVLSIFESKRNPYWTMLEYKKGYLYVSKKPTCTITCRQELPRVYSMAGSVTCAWRDTIMQKGDYFTGRVRGVIVPADRAIDIDSELDFKICEMLLKQRKV